MEGNAKSHVGVSNWKCIFPIQVPRTLNSTHGSIRGPGTQVKCPYSANTGCRLTLWPHLMSPSLLPPILRPHHSLALHTHSARSTWAVCFCFSIWNALPLDLCICFISAQISPSPRGLFWPAPSKLATCPCHPPFLMVVITLKSLCSSKCSCVYPPFPSLKSELWGAGTSRTCLGPYPQHLKQCLAQRRGLIHVC